MMLLSCVFSRWRDPSGFQDLANAPYAIVESTFPNYVDHVNHMDTRTFAQRYWYSDDFWNNDGPIFLYICAEARGGFPAEKSFFMELVQRYKGIGVALEHRYYGNSIPVDNLSVENLQYLSHTQALADAAHFITQFKKKYQDRAQKPIKVFCVGGSYAGALSAWARFKYPHVFDGALASSAVVNAIQDFYLFDEQVRTSILKSGKDCQDNIVALTSMINQLWKMDPIQAKQKYDANFMEWDDFMFYFADIFVETVQYGHRTELCNFLKTIMKDTKIHEKLRDFGVRYGTSPRPYSFRFIRDIKPNINNNYRQWTYQYCSSLGYFNTPGREVPLRFKDMNLTYWRRYCEKSFETPIYPDTFHTNTLYGEFDIVKHTSKIIFTNGGEDPWQWAGIRK
jgi:hypothetical protein